MNLPNGDWPELLASYSYIAWVSTRNRSYRYVQLLCNKFVQLSVVIVHAVHVHCAWPDSTKYHIIEKRRGRCLLRTNTEAF
jgi:hypothetical protein